ncbi:MAG: DNA polymerase III subunit gamma/tau [Bacteroidales bacterium]
MQKYIVSARKYRPSTFQDVVGQGTITTTLRNAIATNQLGHAYLFSGPRGVGKTTCARIYAKTINCQNLSPEGEACNACESCVSFNENRSYSIHELDAASNNSVDDIRSLTEKVRIPPQIGSYSIYIIDEVHMLSQAAFNAFLKTLEEPPAHAIFVLATTEKHKIIPTILSRCQIYDFNRISVEDAVDYLKSIAGKEGLEYEEDALHVVAQKADGAMRDALSIFDQVVSFSGKKITYKQVIDHLNILDSEYYFRLTDIMLRNEVPAALLLFNDVLAKGFDARNFINGFSAHLRDLMVSKDPETLALLEVGSGIREKYMNQTREVPLAFLYEGLDICNQADVQFRFSRNQRLTVELALVKLARLTDLQKKKSLRESPPEQAPSSGPRTASPETTVKASPSESPARTGTSAPTPPPVSGTVPQVVPPTTQQPVSGKVMQSEPGNVPEGSDVGPESKEKKMVGDPVVRKGGISIRDSLRSAASPVTEKTRPANASGNDADQNLATEPVTKPDEEPREGTPALAETKPMNAEDLLRAWDAYAEHVKDKKPRVYSTLTNAKPRVDSLGVVQVKLGSEAQIDHFQRHVRPGLLAHLRETAGMEAPEFHVTLEEQGDQEKKIYTDQDKLAYLLTLNPELANLKNRFALDFDD